MPVVFGTRKPQRTPGLAAGDDEALRLGEELWADSPSLAEILKEKKLPPDFEGPFEYTHRRNGATDIYFVAGTGKAECAFRVSGKQPELWDPVSGKVDAEVAWQAAADGRTRSDARSAAGWVGVRGVQKTGVGRSAVGDPNRARLSKC